MKYIKTDWEIPYFNFALEDYLLNVAPEDDYVFFYIHKPSIIIGKFQNTIEEINKDFVEQENIIVARRLSGGGAVYHDHGNLNFSFVHKAGKTDINNFKKFTRPVIEAMEELGLDAVLSGRNDIMIDTKKVSGNAQCYKNGRILHHGTLLYNADMSNLSKALKVKDLKIESKGIKSVRSRVGNIADYLKQDMDIQEFKAFLLKHFKQKSDISEFQITPEIEEYIAKKADELKKWDWVWGKSPTYSLEKLDKFTCGLVNVKMNVSKGVIRELRIFGDFFTSEELSNLENALIGVKLQKEDLDKALAPYNIGEYFHQMCNQDFVEFLLRQ
ncbi:lipoate--protein ligase [Clostridia bacterium]|nr:lipoate--protein ligase [Clostridia bacterium]